MNSITYRWLDPADPDYELSLIEIRKQISSLGWTPLPDFPYFRAICAYSAGVLIGFHILQTFPHPEPLWVHPDHRGSSVALHLSNRMFDYLSSMSTRGYVVIADSPVVEKLCVKYGMRRVEAPVFIGG